MTLLTPKEAEARAYTPEQIAGLTAAYEGVLATLNVVDRIDLAKYAIARKLFELAESDRECRPALLYTRALTELDLQESNQLAAGLSGDPSPIRSASKASRSKQRTARK